MSVLVWLLRAGLFEWRCGFAGAALRVADAALRVAPFLNPDIGVAVRQGLFGPTER